MLLELRARDCGVTSRAFVPGSSSLFSAERISTMAGESSERQLMITESIVL